MTAPEKIYLQEPTKVRTEKKYDNDVEYIRTDVFVEKAKNWLYLQLNEINMEGEDMENFLKDFIKYMKGE